MRINIPGIGLQDIDMEEVLERASTIPRPPLNKKRPLPRPPLNQVRPTDSPVISEGFPGGIGMGGTQLGERITGPDAFDAMFGRGKSSRPDVSVEIPETINIPGVGQIQLPTPQSPAKTETDSIAFPDPFANETDPNLSELDRLKNQYDRLTGMRFFRDPGPGHFNEIKELAQQIYGLDNTFESPYLQTETQPVETQTETAPTAPTPTGSYESSYIDWLESKPQPPTIRPARRIGGGPAYKKAQQQYKKDLASWEANKPSRDTFTRTLPTRTFPEPPPRNEPVETQPGASKPPREPPINPFEGYVPRNILAPSFDPKDVSAQRQMVADARARMTPGANIQGGGYLTYDNPMLGNKQTQFGGYGQPMPTAPLMNYAGLSSPITYSTPAPNPDAQPGGPPPPQIIR